MVPVIVRETQTPARNLILCLFGCCTWSLRESWKLPHLRQSPTPQGVSSLSAGTRNLRAGLIHPCVFRPHTCSVKHEPVPARQGLMYRHSNKTSLCTMGVCAIAHEMSLATNPCTTGLFEHMQKQCPVHIFKPNDRTGPFHLEPMGITQPTISPNDVPLCLGGTEGGTSPSGYGLALLGFFTLLGGSSQAQYLVTLVQKSQGWPFGNIWKDVSTWEDRSSLDYTDT